MQQVDAIAAERDAQSVTRVTVGIGPLSGVEAQLLVNAFTIARAGSAASSAELEVEHLPVKVRCNSCEQESEVKPNKMTCTHCGDWRTTLVSGDELMLLSVELEQAVQDTAVNS